jgi:hypothetical protein
MTFLGSERLHTNTSIFVKTTLHSRDAHFWRSVRQYRNMAWQTAAARQTQLYGLAGKSLHHPQPMGGGLHNPQPMKWYISPPELSEMVKLP